MGLKKQYPPRRPERDEFLSKHWIRTYMWNDRHQEDHDDCAEIWCCPSFDVYGQ